MLACVVPICFWLGLLIVVFAYFLPNYWNFWFGDVDFLKSRMCNCSDMWCMQQIISGFRGWGEWRAPNAVARLSPLSWRLGRERTTLKGCRGVVEGFSFLLRWAARGHPCFDWESGLRKQKKGQKLEASRRKSKERKETDQGGQKARRRLGAAGGERPGRRGNHECGGENTDPPLTTHVIAFRGPSHS